MTDRYIYIDDWYLNEAKKVKLFKDIGLTYTTNNAKI